MTKRFAGCLVTLIFAAFVLLPHGAFAAEKTVELKVPLCEWLDSAETVRDIVRKIDGVTSATADAETHKVAVTFDDQKTSVEKIRKTLIENDYPPEWKEKGTA
jgi:copper chaperone CopZ